MVWLASSNFMEISSHSSSTSLSFLVANLYNFSCFSKTLYNFAYAMWMSSCSSIFSNLDSTKSYSSFTSSTIPSVGFIVAVKAFRIPSSSLSKSSSGSMSLKVAASVLLFPMVLRYVRHSYFMWHKPWHPKHFGPEGTVYWPPSLASFFPLS